MKKFILFIAILVKKVKTDDLISISNDLTYKILLSMFPLILFLFSILGYLELDATHLIQQVSLYLPEYLTYMMESFLNEVLTLRRASILSTSLAIAVFSASSGFNSVIKGINKAYGYKDERSFIKRRLLSFFLVFIFTITIIVTLVMLIFNDWILTFITTYFNTNNFTTHFFGFFGNVVSMFLMLCAVIAINKLSVLKKVRIRNLLPGALITVLVWVLASYGFNIYVNNFSRHSSLYGSVAGIVILLIWLNIICTVLLLGSAVNVILEQDD
ncbi:MAG: YihY/virulence factor BrkB family protein [Defluviitaleaceae bacterium]|nr:YihY/virulence factor BrkB family protein [Defluviitaleaceae bacterium]